jgi:hypothetical protein
LTRDATIRVGVAIVGGLVRVEVEELVVALIAR